MSKLRLVTMGLKVVAIAACTVTAVGAAATMSAGQAQAQALRYMSCGELWYARNAIYARQGYCFKTARARAVFGPGCFSPYGRLTGWQQRRVNRIVRWEYRKGCR